MVKRNRMKLLSWVFICRKARERGYRLDLFSKWLAITNPASVQRAIAAGAIVPGCDIPSAASNFRSMREKAHKPDGGTDDDADGNYKKSRANHIRPLSFLRIRVLLLSQKRSHPFMGQARSTVQWEILDEVLDLSRGPESAG